MNSKSHFKKNTRLLAGKLFPFVKHSSRAGLTKGNCGQNRELVRVGREQCLLYMLSFAKGKNLVVCQLSKPSIEETN